MLEIGRHFNISVIFTSHCATMGNDTKRILNECHSITIFPKNLGGKTSKYLLDQYLGMDKEQIKKLKKVNSRWVTILKTYPQCIISEKCAWVINNE
jgi:UDP-glucose 4-epimerase